MKRNPCCCVFKARWGFCSSPQGLFFHEAYGFYPGQVLIGPAKVFSNVQWLSGVKPVLSRKCKFRVVVEEVCRHQLFHRRRLALGKVIVVTLSVCLLLSGESGRAESDLDHQELLSPRFRRRLSSSLQHHAGEPLQVGYVTSDVLLLHARVDPVT